MIPALRQRLILACPDCGRRCFPVFLRWNWKHVPCQHPDQFRESNEGSAVWRWLINPRGQLTVWRNERWPVPNSYSALTFTLPSKNNLENQIPSCQRQKNTSGFGLFRLTVPWLALWTTPLHVYLLWCRLQLLFTHRYITTICNDVNMNYRKQVTACLWAQTGLTATFRHATGQCGSCLAHVWSGPANWGFFFNCTGFFKRRKPKGEYYPIYHKNTCSVWTVLPFISRSRSTLSPWSDANSLEWWEFRLINQIMKTPEMYYRLVCSLSTKLLQLQVESMFWSDAIGAIKQHPSVLFFLFIWEKAFTNRW